MVFFVMQVSKNRKISTTIQLFCCFYKTDISTLQSPNNYGESFVTDVKTSMIYDCLMPHKSDSITFSVILVIARRKQTSIYSWKKRGNENENHMFLLKVLGIGNTKKENRSK